MAYSFKTPPAKPAFGTYIESLDAGEYILKKRARAKYCHSNRCPGQPTVTSQGDLLILQQSKRLDAYCFNLPFNKRNLNINLITTLDLSGCCVVQTNPALPALPACPASIPEPDNLTNAFYIDYTIDPNGCLFGKTLCGSNNYLRRLRYNIPSYK